MWTGDYFYLRIYTQTTLAAPRLKNHQLTYWCVFNEQWESVNLYRREESIQKDIIIAWKVRFFSTVMKTLNPENTSSALIQLWSLHRIWLTTFLTVYTQHILPFIQSSKHILNDSLGVRHIQAYCIELTSFAWALTHLEIDKDSLHFLWTQDLLQRHHVILEEKGGLFFLSINVTRNNFFLFHLKDALAELLDVQEFISSAAQLKVNCKKKKKINTVVKLQHIVAHQVREVI